MSHSPKNFDEITSLFSGNLSFRQSVRSAKGLFGKRSVQQKVCSAKCLSAKCPGTENCVPSTNTDPKDSEVSNGSLVGLVSSYPEGNEEMGGIQTYQIRIMLNPAQHHHHHQSQL